MKIVHIALSLFVFGFFCSTTDGSTFDKAFLWLDAHANFQRLGTAEGVSRILKEAKSVGFTDVVVDLRGIDGYVLYPSHIAPVLKEFNGFKRSDDYNYPLVVLNEAHKLGLRVYFSLNVFSEGDRKTHLGIAYEKHPDWQVQVYTKDGVVPISHSNEEIAIFVNPVLPAVQEYELSLIKEVVSMYRPDGIILDRARFPNISGDFSVASRKSFEKFLGKSIDRWPEDVYKIEVSNDGKVNMIPGPYYKEWLEWRAKVIHDFFKKARSTVKSVSSKIAFGDYVGAWYPTYFNVGVNWASDKYRTDKDYSWATDKYHKTGYAKYLDLLFVGNYFFDVTEQEAIKSHTPPPDSGKKPEDYWWYSVEGSAKIAKRVVAGATPVYGSLYVQQYVERNDPHQFVRAMKEVLKETEGIMVFDLVHLDKNDWWKYAAEGLKGD